MSTEVATIKDDVINRFRRIGGILLTILLAIILIYAVIKIYHLIKKPANARYIEGGGEIPSDFDLKGWTDAIFKVIHAGEWTQTKDDVFGAFNTLNDNQMIAIYNDWNERYHDFKTFWLFPMGTLTQAVKDEFGYGIIGKNNRDIMIANLERLKLP